VLLGHEGPQAVEVDGGAEVGVPLVVEVPHTDLSEVTRMAELRKEQRLVSNGCKCIGAENEQRG
jgi:hypothetical protein